MDSTRNPMREEVTWKVEKCKELGINLFVEDNSYVAESMRKRGVNALEVDKWKLARLSGVSSARISSQIYQKGLIRIFDTNSSNIKRS